ncbi:MAG: Fic family protein [Gammaproteobacteria bacterium]
MLTTTKLNTNLFTELRKLDEVILSTYDELKQCDSDELLAIHKYALVSNIGASTRIENALLTDPEVYWLDTVLTKDGHITALRKNWSKIENKLSKDRERSIEEVAGCRQMLILIYENANDFFPLRESDLRALHQQLMEPYLKKSPYVGNYKIQSNSVFERNQHSGEERIIFKTADAGPMTNVAMSDLVQWYNDVQMLDSLSIVVACEFVYRFLAIHPFQDGNGRLSRGLFLLALLQSSYLTLSFVAQFLAIDRAIEKHKLEYYDVLNRCSDGKFSQDPHLYKMEHFIQFMLKILQEALADILYYRKKYLAVKQLSESGIKILECFEDNPEIRLKTKDLREKTGLPRRTINNILVKLLDAKLIQQYGRGAASRYQITF